MGYDRFFDPLRSRVVTVGSLLRESKLVEGMNIMNRRRRSEVRKL